jgi:hypothetical protein
MLLLLLSVTTPMGTGDAIHDSVLLHPLFSHSHLVNGRIVSHQQMEEMNARPTRPSSSRGPAIGAGAGASAALADAAAISPAPPWQDAQLDLPLPSGFAPPAGIPLQGVTFAPPDPPPTWRSATAR